MIWITFQDVSQFPDVSNSLSALKGLQGNKTWQRFSQFSAFFNGERDTFNEKSIKWKTLLLHFLLCTTKCLWKSLQRVKAIWHFSVCFHLWISSELRHFQQSRQFVANCLKLISQIFCNHCRNLGALWIFEDAQSKEELNSGNFYKTLERLSRLFTTKHSSRMSIVSPFACAPPLSTSASTKIYSNSSNGRKDS